MANTKYVFQVRAVFEDQEGRYGPQSDDVITSESLATKLLKFSILVKQGNPPIYRLLAQELARSRNPTAKTRKLELGEFFLEQSILTIFKSLYCTLKLIMNIQYNFGNNRKFIKRNFRKNNYASWCNWFGEDHFS